MRHILNYISRSISFNINADDKLKAVFNGKLKVSMFEMTKLVSEYLGLADFAAKIAQPVFVKKDALAGVDGDARIARCRGACL